MNQATEILINAQLVTHDDQEQYYEFVLDESLKVMECVKVNSSITGNLQAILNASHNLDGMLFELNHVRVNPKVDNTHIISCLTLALENIGVNVNNPPTQDSMALCFKPLGEISDNVRFYLDNKSHLVFLSPATRPKLVSCQKKINS